MDPSHCRRSGALRVAALVLVTVACQKEKSEAPQLGEPIGAQVPARGEAPPLSIAFAVARGHDPVPLLAPLVGVVSSAAAGCSTLAKETADGPIAVEFQIEQGKMKVPPRPSPPGASCLTTALDGKALGTPEANPLAARVELKMGAPAKP